MTNPFEELMPAGAEDEEEELQENAAGESEEDLEEEAEDLMADMPRRPKKSPTLPPISPPEFPPASARSAPSVSPEPQPGPSRQGEAEAGEQKRSWDEPEEVIEKRKEGEFSSLTFRQAADRGMLKPDRYYMTGSFLRDLFGVRLKISERDFERFLEDPAYRKRITDKGEPD